MCISRHGEATAGVLVFSHKLILSLIYIYFSTGKGEGRIAPQFFFLSYIPFIETYLAHIVSVHTLTFFLLLFSSFSSFFLLFFRSTSLLLVIAPCCLFCLDLAVGYSPNRFRYQP